MGGAVVEFHAFKDNEQRFIVKELAIVSAHAQYQIIFNPPYCLCKLNEKMRKSVRWLSRHYHHIGWDYSGIPYNEDLIRTFVKSFPVIYSKGLEKVNFLQEFHCNVVEIDATLKPCHCTVDCILPQHNSGSKCAFRSAKGFYKALCSDLSQSSFYHHGERLDSVVSRAKSSRRCHD